MKLPENDGFSIKVGLSTACLLYNISRTHDYQVHTAGDASAIGGYAARISTVSKVLVHFAFSEEQENLSSTHRELLVVVRLFEV
jgi:hypothetical protein